MGSGAVTFRNQKNRVRYKLFVSAFDISPHGVGVNTAPPVSAGGTPDSLRRGRGVAVGENRLGRNVRGRVLLKGAGNPPWGPGCAKGARVSGSGLERGAPLDSP